MTETSSEKPPITWERFKYLVDTHDLTYQYTDDHSVWERGHKERSTINDYSRFFPIEDVRTVWNAMVDRKLRPDARVDFYWVGTKV